MPTPTVTLTTVLKSTDASFEGNITLKSDGSDFPFVNANARIYQYSTGTPSTTPDISTFYNSSWEDTPSGYNAAISLIGDNNAHHFASIVADKPTYFVYKDATKNQEFVLNISENFKTLPDNPSLSFGNETTSYGTQEQIGIIVNASYSSSDVTNKYIVTLATKSSDPITSEAIPTLLNDKTIGANEQATTNLDKITKENEGYYDISTKLNSVNTNGLFVVDYVDATSAISNTIVYPKVYKTTTTNNLHFVSVLVEIDPTTKNIIKVNNTITDAKSGNVAHLKSEYQPISANTSDITVSTNKDVNGNRMITISPKDNGSFSNTAETYIVYTDADCGDDDFINFISSSIESGNLSTTATDWVTIGNYKIGKATYDGNLTTASGPAKISGNNKIIAKIYTIKDLSDNKICAYDYTTQYEINTTSYKAITTLNSSTAERITPSLDVKLASTPVDDITDVSAKIYFETGNGFKYDAACENNYLVMITTENTTPFSISTDGTIAATDYVEKDIISNDAITTNSTKTLFSFKTSGVAADGFNFTKLNPNTKYYVYICQAEKVTCDGTDIRYYAASDGTNNNLTTSFTTLPPTMKGFYAKYDKTDATQTLTGYGYKPETENTYKYDENYIPTGANAVLYVNIPESEFTTPTFDNFASTEALSNDENIFIKGYIPTQITLEEGNGAITSITNPANLQVEIGIVCTVSESVVNHAVTAPATGILVAVPVALAHSSSSETTTTYDVRYNPNFTIGTTGNVRKITLPSDNDVNNLALQITKISEDKNNNNNVNNSTKISLTVVTTNGYSIFKTSTSDNARTADVWHNLFINSPFFTGNDVSKLDHSVVVNNVVDIIITNNDAFDLVALNTTKATTGTGDNVINTELVNPYFTDNFTNVVLNVKPVPAEQSKFTTTKYTNLSNKGLTLNFAPMENKADKRMVFAYNHEATEPTDFSANISSIETITSSLTPEEYTSNINNVAETKNGKFGDALKEEGSVKLIGLIDGDATTLNVTGLEGEHWYSFYTLSVNETKNGTCNNNTESIDRYVPAIKTVAATENANMFAVQTPNQVDKLTFTEMNKNDVTVKYKPISSNTAVFAMHLNSNNSEPDAQAWATALDAWKNKIKTSGNNEINITTTANPVFNYSQGTAIKNGDNNTGIKYLGTIRNDADPTSNEYTEKSCKIEALAGDRVAFFFANVSCDNDNKLQDVVTTTISKVYQTNADPTLNVIVSTNPNTYSRPCNQAANLTFSEVTATGATLSWNTSNDAAGYLIVASEMPIDNYEFMKYFSQYAATFDDYNNADKYEFYNNINKYTAKVWNLNPLDPDNICLGTRYTVGATYEVKPNENNTDGTKSITLLANIQDGSTSSFTLDNLDANVKYLGVIAYKAVTADEYNSLARYTYNFATNFNNVQPFGVVTPTRQSKMLTFMNTNAIGYTVRVGSLGNGDGRLMVATDVEKSNTEWNSLAQDIENDINNTNTNNFTWLNATNPIELSTVTPGFIKVIDLPENSREITVENPANTMYYHVFEYNKSGNTYRINPANSTLNPRSKDFVPALPDILISSDVKCTSAELTWTCGDNSTNNVRNYLLDVYNENMSEYSYYQSLDVDNVNEWYLDGLDNGTYKWRVTAVSNGYTYKSSVWGTITINSSNATCSAPAITGIEVKHNGVKPEKDVLNIETSETFSAIFTFDKATVLASNMDPMSAKFPINIRKNTEGTEGTIVTPLDNQYNIVSYAWNTDNSKFTLNYEIAQNQNFQDNDCYFVIGENVFANMNNVSAKNVATPNETTTNYYKFTIDRTRPTITNVVAKAKAPTETLQPCGNEPLTLIYGEDFVELEAELSEPIVLKGNGPKLTFGWGNNNAANGQQQEFTGTCVNNKAVSFKLATKNAETNEYTEITSQTELAKGSKYMLVSIPTIAVDINGADLSTLLVNVFNENDKNFADINGNKAENSVVYLYDQNNDNIKYVQNFPNTDFKEAEKVTLNIDNTAYTNYKKDGNNLYIKADQVVNNFPIQLKLVDNGDAVNDFNQIDPVDHNVCKVELFVAKQPIGGLVPAPSPDPIYTLVATISASQSYSPLTLDLTKLEEAKYVLKFVVTEKTGRTFVDNKSFITIDKTVPTYTITKGNNNACTTKTTISYKVTFSENVISNVTNTDIASIISGAVSINRYDSKYATAFTPLTCVLLSTDPSNPALVADQYALTISKVTESKEYKVEITLGDANFDNQKYALVLGDSINTQITDNAGNNLNGMSVDPEMWVLDCVPPTVDVKFYKDEAMTTEIATNAYLKANDKIYVKATATEGLGELTVLDSKMYFDNKNTESLVSDVKFELLNLENLTYKTVFTVPTEYTNSAQDGNLLIFDFNFQDSVGNVATTTTTTTDPAISLSNYTPGFKADLKAPNLKQNAFASNNTNTALAKSGNVVTLTLEANEAIQQPNVTFKLNGELTTIVPSYKKNTNENYTIEEDASDNSKYWTAFFTVVSGQDGKLTYEANANDLAGNNSNSLNEETNFITIDTKKPVISAVAITAGSGKITKDANNEFSETTPYEVTTTTTTENNKTTYYAKAIAATTDPIYTSVVALTFTSTEELNETSLGNNITLNVGNNNSFDKFIKHEKSEELYNYTILGYLSDANLSEFEGDVAFNMPTTITDNTGNTIASAISTTGDNSVAHIDNVLPTIVKASAVSNNNNTTLAKPDDKITLKFEFSEPVTTNGLQVYTSDVAKNTTFALKCADASYNEITNTNTTSSKYFVGTFTATNVLISSFGDNGELNYKKLDVKDRVDNSATFTSSNKVLSPNVTLDNVIPVCNQITCSSNNTHNDLFAKEGDNLTITFTTSEKIQTPGKPKLKAGETSIIETENLQWTASNSYKTWTTIVNIANEGYNGALTIEFAEGTIKDIAGNSALAATNNTTNITIDSKAPVLTLTNGTDEYKNDDKIDNTCKFKFNLDEKNRTTTKVTITSGSIVSTKTFTTTTNTDTEETVEIVANGLATDVTTTNGWSADLGTIQNENITFKLEHTDKAGNSATKEYTLYKVSNVEPAVVNSTIASNRTNDTQNATSCNTITIRVTPNESTESVEAEYSINNAEPPTHVTLTEVTPAGTFEYVIPNAEYAELTADATITLKKLTLSNGACTTKEYSSAESTLASVVPNPTVTMKASTEASMPENGAIAIKFGTETMENNTKTVCAGSTNSVKAELPSEAKSFDTPTWAWSYKTSEQEAEYTPITAENANSTGLVFANYNTNEITVTANNNVYLKATATLTSECNNTTLITSTNAVLLMNTNILAQDGRSITPIKACQGEPVTFTYTPATNDPESTTYTWYNDGTEVTGDAISEDGKSVTLTLNTTSTTLKVVATKPDYCPSEGIETEQQISVSNVRIAPGTFTYNNNAVNTSKPYKICPNQTITFNDDAGGVVLQYSNRSSINDATEVNPADIKALINTQTPAMITAGETNDTWVEISGTGFSFIAGHKYRVKLQYTNENACQEVVYSDEITIECKDAMPGQNNTTIVNAENATIANNEITVVAGNQVELHINGDYPQGTSEDPTTIKWLKTTTTNNVIPSLDDPWIELSNAGATYITEAQNGNNTTWYRAQITNVNYCPSSFYTSNFVKVITIEQTNFGSYANNAIKTCGTDGSLENVVLTLNNANFAGKWQKKNTEADTWEDLSNETIDAAIEPKTLTVQNIGTYRFANATTPNANIPTATVSIKPTFEVGTIAVNTNNTPITNTNGVYTVCANNSILQKSLFTYTNLNNNNVPTQTNVQYVVSNDEPDASATWNIIPNNGTVTITGKTWFRMSATVNADIYCGSETVYTAPIAITFGSGDAPTITGLTITQNLDNIESGNSVTYTASATAGLDDANSTYSYEWKDGTTTLGTTQVPTFIKIWNHSNTTSSPEEHSVTVTVTATQNCSNNTSTAVTSNVTTTTVTSGTSTSPDANVNALTSLTSGSLSMSFITPIVSKQAGTESVVILAKATTSSISNLNVLSAAEKEALQTIILNNTLSTYATQGATTRTDRNLANGITFNVTTGSELNGYKVMYACTDSVFKITGLSRRTKYNIVALTYVNNNGVFTFSSNPGYNATTNTTDQALDGIRQIVIRTSVNPKDVESDENYEGNFTVSTVNPNPVTGSEINFTVESIETANFTIELFNTNGELIISENRNLTAGKNALKLNLNTQKGGLPIGAYTLRVTSNGAAMTQPVRIVR